MPDKRSELLFSVTRKDFEFQTFRSGGKGGQHQNKRDSGVRLIHRASGARGESRKKSQSQNRKLAFERLVNTPEFQGWLKREAAKAMMTVDDKRRREKSIQQSVRRQMQSDNLCIEHLVDGKWVEAGNDG
jgi:protein subunit release factor B